MLRGAEITEKKRSELIVMWKIEQKMCLSVETELEQKNTRIF